MFEFNQEYPAEKLAGLMNQVPPKGKEKKSISLRNEEWDLAKKKITRAFSEGYRYFKVQNGIKLYKDDSKLDDSDDGEFLNLDNFLECIYFSWFTNRAWLIYKGKELIGVAINFRPKGWQYRFSRILWEGEDQKNYAYLVNEGRGICLCIEKSDSMDIAPLGCPIFRTEKEWEDFKHEKE